MQCGWGEKTSNYYKQQAIPANGCERGNLACRWQGTSTFPRRSYTIIVSVPKVANACHKLSCDQYPPFFPLDCIWSNTLISSLDDVSRNVGLPAVNRFLWCWSKEETSRKSASGFCSELCGLHYLAASRQQCELWEICVFLVLYWCWVLHISLH